MENLRSLPEVLMLNKGQHMSELTHFHFDASELLTG